jgi:hypothetical protein
MACAWGGFAGYGVAMVASYFVGQKYYPIDYPIKDIALYVVLAWVCFRLMELSADWSMIGQLAFNTLLIIIFVAVILKRDLPLDPILKKLGIKH